jgi:hypothetical protein
MTQKIARARPRGPTPFTINTQTKSRAMKAARKTRRSRRAFPPQTARRTKRGGVIGVIVLAVCFVIVTIARLMHAHSVARAGETAYSTPPPVDVVIARPASAGQDLVLPGETAG